MKKMDYSSGNVIATYRYPGVTVEINDAACRNNTKAEDEAALQGIYRAAWNILDKLNLQKMEFLTGEKVANQIVTREALYNLVGQYYQLPPASTIEFAKDEDCDIWMLSWPRGNGRVNTASITVQYKRILVTLSTERGLGMHEPEEEDLVKADFTWRPAKS